MTLESFQTLFVVFLVLTIVFLILSVVFFFVFDIRKIFSIKTGRAVRKSVEELNEINRSEDNRKRKKYKGHSMQLSKELTGDFDRVTGEMTGDVVSEGVNIEETTMTEQLENNETIILKQESIQVNETELLVTRKNTSPETEVLVAPQDEKVDIPKFQPSTTENTDVEVGVFNITEKKEVTFADEII